ncbi:MULTISPECIES: tryptophan synthase subunit alpha [Microbacterium]|uniref:tryptophan synthase subunit alpha n=1 Tax=Microbacterium TaxID=33882 RepID=UPI00217E69FF|nr:MULTISPECIES: tryptophan synthase subunit alpha [Microbacterium]UWF77514.1 tryptophan synthase subunit alpha [Microbacterium neungamense]WCM55679.1 tryptophan synthase subunit alpha [Microbacterium sp. EF45047]
MTPFPRRASLEVLRAEAGDERAVLVHERLRHGQDPWDFMSEIPSVDELVVLLLRADVVAARGGNVRDRGWNDGILRRIALEYPELTPTVWRMLG